ncbi:MAG: hypothetical protein E6K70_05860, partial [Planctomycetota bacterium]
MRKLLAFALLLALSLVALSPALARDLRRSRFAADCEESVAAPSPVCNWVEQQVTCYRPEYRTRTVQRTVNRLVPKEVEETFRYTELVREVTP